MSYFRRGLWILLGVALACSCKSKSFSSKADKTEAPVAEPAKTDDVQKKSEPLVLPEPFKLDTLDICRKLLGIPEGEECRLPGNSIFGGSYQNGAITMVNPRTNAASCPTGFDANLSMTISVAGAAVGSSDPYVDSRLYLCLVSDNTEYPVTQDPDCAPGTAKVTAVDGRTACSDLPPKICTVLGGNFDGASGRCGIKPQESVFGGMFVSGDDDVGLGSVTVNDQDAANVPVTEFCENSNKFSANGDCSCPANFTGYTSSSMVEFMAGYDRPTYCVGQENAELVSNSDPTPLDGCKNEWERSYQVDDQKVCSAMVEEICRSLGGAIDSTANKCIYSRDSFFGGSFQIGFSNHQMTDGVPWNQLPPTLRDNTIVNPNQFCEAPNPESGLEKELQCSCPQGFLRHPLMYHPETQDPAGDYDKEFICVRQ
ncbi:MAG: hypothetical protein HRU19_24285 [Pseudobacteriovorax sp.]|nr:hypothetical protein [Pseudobacteriovorax sp.]